MTGMLVLTEPDLRKAVRLDASAVDCVEDAFAALATKPVVMPPILRLDIVEHRGEVDVKTAYVPGLDGFAIKVSPGFFDNPKLGLPSLNGLMILFSTKTGLVEALLLDNGYLTDVRTAAAGAVAAKHLSRPDSQVATIFGAGIQARLQLEALTLVRPIKRARIWARDFAKAETAAQDLSTSLGIAVEAVPNPESACDGADIIVTTTPAEQPILKAEWVQPGQHITAMGSDSEHKNEIDPAILPRALYIADSLGQTRRLGELHHAIRAGLIEPDRSFPELGQVVASQAPGRESPDAMTLCDLTGTGVQDTAIATLAHARAREAGAGRPIDTKEATGDVP
ncbi:ectoine utilization protein EutC [Microvirga sp. 3-52]|uniref:ectoine utilization protein EutC n=1 Tax=Microvirga sp. 3-52 TaxID=2792425 RepID=UPI001AD54D5A|nr:ectoine utilization protein EutC [Microvirga sp. 3-52]MBO1903563.1 ectoine utilization protein EutC [Microvirga sp. 3-52]MBS7450842.1 ectoine utilization protein EutC [Microvirga sp. 3-52]